MLIVVNAVDCNARMKTRLLYDSVVVGFLRAIFPVLRRFFEVGPEPSAQTN